MGWEVYFRGSLTHLGERMNALRRDEPISFRFPVTRNVPETTLVAGAHPGRSYALLCVGLGFFPSRIGGFAFAVACVLHGAYPSGFELGAQVWRAPIMLRRLIPSESPPHVKQSSLMC